MDDERKLPPKMPLKSRLRSALAGIWSRTAKAWSQAEWPGKARDKLRTGVLDPLSERAATWHLREKLTRILPQDLAHSLPRTFEPLALAEWLSQALQKQGAAFYGKIITLVLCTYFLADVSAWLLGRYIPEPPPARPSFHTEKKKTRTLEELNPIFARNLFSSQKLIPGEENLVASTGPQDLGGAPVKTSLPFNLIGTLILRDELRSIATIEDKSANVVFPVRVEDEIPSKARIVSIEPRRVVFVNVSSGRREFVELPQDAQSNAPRISVGGPKGGGIEKVSPTQFNIAKTEIDKTMADLNNVLTQARCVPHVENGLPAGYRCFQIVPGSIYDKLGMQNGDVLTAINGQQLSDPAKIFEQLSALKDASQVDLSFKRDGRQMNMHYEIR